MNATVEEGGKLDIEVVGGDRSQKVSLTGDGIHMPAFDLPDGPFKLRVKMRNATLYTMYIE